VTLYRANAVLRDASGREVGSRYPLWSGDVAGQRDAVDAAREALVPHVGDVRVDTAVVTVTGADGTKVTFTEYAEDVRAGKFVSAQQSTLILDDENIPEEVRKRIAEEARAEQERLAREAVASMPTVTEKLRARREELAASGELGKDPVDDFFASMPGGQKGAEHARWGPAGEKVDWFVFDEASSIPKETWDKIEEELSSTPLHRAPSSSPWSKLDGKDILDNCRRAAEQMRNMGCEPDKMLVGERAYRAIVEQLRVVGDLPSGAGVDYTGPVVFNGLPIHRSGSDDDRIQTVRSPRAQLPWTREDLEKAEFYVDETSPGGDSSFISMRRRRPQDFTLGKGELFVQQSGQPWKYIGKVPEFKVTVEQQRALQSYLDEPDRYKTHILGRFP
jgi:hypothetical protein